MTARKILTMSAIRPYGLLAVTAVVLASCTHGEPLMHREQPGPPPDLAYIATAAGRWRHLAAAARDWTPHPPLGQADVAALTAVYERIARHGDDLKLSKFLYAAGDVPNRQELEDFIRLFRVLHFKERVIEVIWDVHLFDIRPLDWTKLPPSLQFLRVPAEEYGYYWGDSDYYTLAWRVTPEEKKYVHAIFMQSQRVSAEYRAWLKKYPPDSHPESMLVASFFDMYFQCDFDG
jgi:hypothetical protein